MKPEFSVAYNGDPACLLDYKRLGMDEIWAGTHIRDSVFGSGRLRQAAEKEIPFEQLGQDFRKAKSLGIRTSFLFNPACTGNNEFSARGIDEISDIAQFINKNKVDYLTLGQPFLTPVFRKLCPEVGIKITSHYNCDNIGKFEFLLEHLKADVVIVSQFANKNFRLLREVVDRWSPDRLEIMCTVRCVMGCPYRTWHSLYYAHGNSIEDEEMAPRFLPCHYDQISNLNILMSAMFVRREDLIYYQDLGINTFKIGERQYSTEKNIECAAYYVGAEKPEFVPQIFYGNTPLIEKIDLKAMDGFYEKFHREECDGTKFNCRECDHCLTFARRVFILNEDYKRRLNLNTKENFFRDDFLRELVGRVERSMRESNNPKSGHFE